jgi:urea transporter
MIRAALRFVGMVFLAAAIVAAVIDGTRSIAEGQLLVSSLARSLESLHPETLARIAGLPGASAALALPTVAVALGLALLFLLLGRSKRDIFG